MATNKQDIAKEHRAPRRSSVSTYRTLLALFGAPAAWVSQMSLSEPLAAYACYPHQVPLSAPLWADLSVILAMISLVCLAAGLFSGYVAWDLWRRARQRPELAGTGGQAFEVDEGQTRYLAMLGTMSSFLFIVAILFTACAVLLVPPCSAWV
ncbi:MAG: hypothetical protein ABI363_04785 [Nitrosospira sp.]